MKAARRARRSGVAADFHRLRIRGKRLRYALEFVSEVYGGQTSRYVRRVVQLQDALGLMQDAQVAAVRLHSLATAEDTELSATTIFTMGGIAERYREESARLLRKLPDKVALLRGSEWQKLASVMERRRVDHEASVQWPPARRPRTATAVPSAPPGPGPDPGPDAPSADGAGAVDTTTTVAGPEATSADGEVAATPEPQALPAEAPIGATVLRALGPHSEPGSQTGS
jgi:hypothetical protein